MCGVLRMSNTRGVCHIRNSVASIEHGGWGRHAGRIVTDRAGFNAEAFYDALNRARDRRGLTWRGLANDAGVSPSTLTRMKQGKRPDVDSMAALARWAGLDVDDFIDGSDDAAGVDVLPRIGALLRADPHLSPDSARAIEEVIAAAYKNFASFEPG